MHLPYLFFKIVFDIKFKFYKFWLKFVKFDVKNAFEQKVPQPVKFMTMGSMSDELDSESNSSGTIDPTTGNPSGNPSEILQTTSSGSNLHSAEHDLESVFEAFERHESKAKSPGISKSPSFGRQFRPPLANNGDPVSSPLQQHRQSPALSTVTSPPAAGERLSGNVTISRSTLQPSASSIEPPQKKTSKSKTSESNVKEENDVVVTNPAGKDVRTPTESFLGTAQHEVQPEMHHKARRRVPRRLGIKSSAPEGEGFFKAEQTFHGVRRPRRSKNKGRNQYQYEEDDQAQSSFGFSGMFDAITTGGVNLFGQVRRFFIILFENSKFRRCSIKISCLQRQLSNKLQVQEFFDEIAPEVLSDADSTFSSSSFR